MKHRCMCCQHRDISDSRQPRICDWCLYRNLRAGRVQLTSEQKRIILEQRTMDDLSAAAARLAAVVGTIEYNFMQIRYQRRTGWTGSPMRWESYTMKQRERMERKPAPRRAYMP